MWIDTHCHLQFEGMDPDVAEEAKAEGVEKIICVGTDLETSKQAIEIANSFENIWATVGLHPHDSKNGLEGFEELLSNEKVVAVGECGLDYYYNHSPQETQREIFATQISMANTHNLALMIHTRAAWDDTFDILKTEGVPERTVFHCFSGGVEEAKRSLDLGAYLSFSGIITFKSADDVRQAAIECPQDRLLVETDAPYLAPEPHRGKTNHPKWVKVVGERLAWIRQVDITTIENACSENTLEVFSLKS